MTTIIMSFSASLNSRMSSIDHKTLHASCDSCGDNIDHLVGKREKCTVGIVRSQFYIWYDKTPEEVEEVLTGRIKAIDEKKLRVSYCQNLATSCGFDFINKENHSHGDLFYKIDETEIHIYCFDDHTEMRIKDDLHNMKGHNDREYNAETNIELSYYNHVLDLNAFKNALNTILQKVTCDIDHKINRLECRKTLFKEKIELINKIMPA